MQVPNVEDAGIGAHDRKAECTSPVLNFPLFIGLAGDVPYQGHDVAQQFNVIVSETNLNARLVASGLFGSPIGKYADSSGAETVKDVFDGAAEPFTIGQQQNHRSNSPRHAQH